MQTRQSVATEAAWWVDQDGRGQSQAEGRFMLSLEVDAHPESSRYPNTALSPKQVPTTVSAGPRVSAPAGRASPSARIASLPSARKPAFLPVRVRGRRAGGPSRAPHSSPERSHGQIWPRPPVRQIQASRACRLAANERAKPAVRGEPERPPADEHQRRSRDWRRRYARSQRQSRSVGGRIETSAPKETANRDERAVASRRQRRRKRLTAMSANALQIWLMGDAGLEPATSALSRRRSPS